MNEEEAEAVTPMDMKSFIFGNNFFGKSVTPGPPEVQAGGLTFPKNEL